MSHEVGDALPPFTIDSVSPDTMRQWAVFLADPNPIHLDPEVVKAKGLGERVINQGPANVAYMMNMLLRAFPDGRIRTMDSRFLDNVYGGDRAVVTGRVTAIQGYVVTCDFALKVEGRGSVNAGSATIEITQNKGES